MPARCQHALNASCLLIITLFWIKATNLYADEIIRLTPAGLARRLVTLSNSIDSQVGWVDLFVVDTVDGAQCKYNAVSHLHDNDIYDRQSFIQMNRHQSGSCVWLVGTVTADEYCAHEADGYGYEWPWFSFTGALKCSGIWFLSSWGVSKRKIKTEREIWRVTICVPYL